MNFEWRTTCFLAWAVRGLLTNSQPSFPDLVQPLFWTLQLTILTPNDHYRGRTVPLTSKRCILYIYSTNTGTEYFEHGIYSQFFLFKIQFVS